MSSQSVNSSNKKIKLTDSKNVSRLPSLGVWTYGRRYAAVKAMRNYRPYEQAQTQATTAWNNVVDDVNKVDPKLNPLSIIEIKEYIKWARNDSRYGQGKKRKFIGMSDNEMTLLPCIMGLDSMVKKNI